MDGRSVNTSDTVVIFFPLHLKNICRCYLQGHLKLYNEDVKIFFVTRVFETYKKKLCTGLFKETVWDGNESRLKSQENWIYVEHNNGVLTLKKLKINGKSKDINTSHIILVNYDFKVFSQCEILSADTCYAYNDRSYFMYLKKIIHDEIMLEVTRKPSVLFYVKTVCLNFLSAIYIRLSSFSKMLLPVTKYFNIALHIDNYLNGFIWAVNSVTVNDKLDVKVTNFLLSVFLDILLGIFFLDWVNSKIPLDSIPNLFLLTAESVVNSIKELINWLRGDPAGLKLNWAFNKVLAVFFSFHIDIWWTFIAYSEPLVKIIFQVFFKLGLLGVTFQAAITADLLALVSFHVYCIYAYAAKLYSFQISSLISLWRLFLGRKKNPLRGKVDSCRYSPEQLFVGTLGFTILLFLLPTTLLYYIVFTSIRLVILIMQGVLMLIRHLNQSLPVYSTLLWFKRSPRISVGIEVTPHRESLKSDFIAVTVQPVTYTWWETIKYFIPDCAPKAGEINLSDLLSSLLIGKLLYPI